MKILCFSDLHIRGKRPYYDNKEMYQKTAKWIATLLHEFQPDLLINLGDTFHSITVSAEDINIAWNFMASLSMECNHLSIPFEIILGNHETDGHNNLLIIFKKLVNLKTKSFYQDTIKKEEIIILPFNGNKDNLKNTMSQIKKDSIIFSHNEFNGSLLTSTLIEKNGIEPDKKLIINGHYHRRNQKEGLLNVGACLSHSFSDAETLDNLQQGLRGATLFDTITLEDQFIVNPHSPIFLNLEISNREEFQELIALSKSELKFCIRAKVKEVYEQSVSDLRDSFNYLQILPWNEEEIKKEKVIVNTSNNILDVLEEHVSNSFTELDKNKLKQIGKEILKHD